MYMHLFHMRHLSCTLPWYRVITKSLRGHFSTYFCHFGQSAHRSVAETWGPHRLYFSIWVCLGLIYISPNSQTCKSYIHSKTIQIPQKTLKYWPFSNNFFLGHERKIKTGKLHFPRDLLEMSNLRGWRRLKPFLWVPSNFTSLSFWKKNWLFFIFDLVDSKALLTNVYAWPLDFFTYSESSRESIQWLLLEKSILTPTSTKSTRLKKRSEKRYTFFFSLHYSHCDGIIIYKSSMLFIDRCITTC